MSIYKSRKSIMTSLESIQEQLLNASDRLREAVIIKNPDDFIRDATVQRFEFTFELYRKTLKKILQSQWVNSIWWPKVVLKAWNKYGLVRDIVYVVNLLENRNMFSHEYDEEKVEDRIEAIVENISIFFEHIQILLDYSDDSDQ